MRLRDPEDFRKPLPLSDLLKAACRNGLSVAAQSPDFVGKRSASQRVRKEFLAVRLLSLFYIRCWKSKARILNVIASSYLYNWWTQNCTKTYQIQRRVKMKPNNDNTRKLTAFGVATPTRPTWGAKDDTTKHRRYWRCNSMKRVIR